MFKKESKSVKIVIPPLKFAFMPIKIRGTSVYVSNRFSAEAREIMRRGFIQGSKKKKRGSEKEPRDFDKDCAGSMYRSSEGWYGIPTTAFRQAMISVCVLLGFVTTTAKKAIFVVPDGFDAKEGQPLVKITKGKPDHFESYTIISGKTPNIAARGRWAAGWEACPVVKFDEGIFTPTDIVNLMMRAGVQIGTGAGRPFSKNSCGQDWGTWEVAENG